MKTRKIADMDVSRLCLGTMTFGTPVNRSSAVDIIHWALDHGINFIDTADMYEGYARCLGSSGGVAEQFVGEALKDRREKAVITTKAGSPVDGPDSTFDISPAHLTRQLDRSLSYLRTDYVDIFELHRPDAHTPLEESLGAVANFVKQGKTRHWGFSNFEADLIRQMVKICDDNGYPRPVVSQPQFSWLSRDAAEQHIPACAEAGIAVTPYRVLESGLLTGKYRRGQPLPEDSRADDECGWLSEPDEAIYDSIEAFNAEADASGLTAGQYALKWALDQPGLTACVVGVKRIDQIAALMPGCESSD
jgi:L-glyceraldehyde 3-phosphate reductase